MILVEPDQILEGLETDTEYRQEDNLSNVAFDFVLSDDEIAEVHCVNKTYSASVWVGSVSYEEGWTVDDLIMNAMDT